MQTRTMRKLPDTLLITAATATATATATTTPRATQQQAVTETIAAMTVMSTAHWHTAVISQTSRTDTEGRVGLVGLDRKPGGRHLVLIHHQTTATATKALLGAAPTTLERHCSPTTYRLTKALPLSGKATAAGPLAIRPQGPVQQQRVPAAMGIRTLAQTVTVVRQQRQTTRDTPTYRILQVNSKRLTGTITAASIAV